MHIQKVLNSSVVLVQDDSGEESILLGKGIALLSPFRKERRREKEKRKKTFEIVWKIYLKVLTFASAF